MGDVVQMNSYREDMTGAGSKSTTYSSGLGNSATGANGISQCENSSTASIDSHKVASTIPGRDSLIPIELAVGSADRNFCLTRMAKYDVCAIHIRMVKDDPDALVYLMSVNDAIWLNKEILEEVDLSEEEVCRRIDLIQMLENVNGALMDSLWDSFTERSQAIIS